MLLKSLPLIFGLAMNATAETEKIMLNWQFNGAAEEPKWGAENDAVMGGLSAGRVVIKDGGLVFSGKLSFENNGGFASVMTNEHKYDLTGATDFKLRVKGDGRTYRFRISTDARHRGSSIVYMASFTPKAGEWEEVKIPLADFQPSHHGNTLNGPPLDLSKVEEIGFLLGDKNADAFSLEVDWLKAE